MKDLSRQKFEENWKQAFDGAEMEPSSSVWSNIELDLVKAESTTIKRKVVFYKWLAAASVFLVVFLGGTFYYVTQTEDIQIAAKKTELPKVEPKKDNSSVVADQNKVETSASQTKKNNYVDNSVSNENRTEQNIPDELNALTSAVIVADEHKILQSAHAQIIQERKTSRERQEVWASLSLMKEVPAVVQGEIVLPRLVLPAMPSVFMASAKKDKSSEDLWASVGFSAGNYNPGFGGQGGNSPLFSMADQTQAAALNSSGRSDASNVGSAYSAGFAMSKKVFTRWVVQSGLNYINQTIGYTSNYVAYTTSNQSKAFVAEYADFSNQSVTITSPYQINSAVEVVSLPLQTGYLLIDRKIGWQLNTGVAADFFVRNTLTDESGNASRFSQGTGEKSPYRAVSWAGLLGTELSYKVARQYRISLVPSMRYSVNSVLKSTSGQTSNPLVMDIGFRFRYIFK